MEQRYAYVLVLDVLRQREGEGVCNILRVLGASEPAKSDVLLVVVASLLKGIHDLLPLFFSLVSSTIASYRAATYLSGVLVSTDRLSVVESNSVNSSSQVGVDNIRVSLGVPGVEHLQSGGNNLRVTVKTSAVKRQALKLLSQLIISICELPTKLVGKRRHKVTLELLESIALLLRLEHPGCLDGTNSTGNLGPDDVAAFVLESRDKIQKRGGLLVSTGSEGTSISKETSTVLNREKTVLGSLAELLQTLRRVVGTVEGRLVSVELVKVGVLNLQGVLAGAEGDRLIDALLGLKTNKDGPESLVLLGLDIGSLEVTVLLEVDLVSILGDSDDGVSNLLGPGSHGRLDILSAGLAQSGPEIGGLGISEGVLLQVGANTLNEDILSEVLGDHAKNGGSLSVGYAVENLVDLGHALNGDLNGVRATETVQVKGGSKIVDNVVLPDLPVGVELVHGVPGHPCSETLVQPETLPEVHSDQVTEPLVSKLVLNNLSNTLLAVNRGSLGVVEKVDNTVGDQSPVLHSSSGEVRDGNHVHLGKRVLDTERFLVERKGARGNVKGEVGVLLVSGGSVYTDRETEIIGLLVAEVSNNKGKKLSTVNPGTFLNE